MPFRARSTSNVDRVDIRGDDVASLGEFSASSGMASPLPKTRICEAQCLIRKSKCMINIILHLPKVKTLFCRCQAQGNNNTFDQFLQWGRGLLKKTLGPSQPRRPAKEAVLPSPSRTEPDGARLSMENLISSEESTSSPESSKDEEPAEGTISAHMEERNSEFRHMAMTGEEITEDWPPPGTPTWSQWLEVVFLLHLFERRSVRPFP